MANPKFEVYIVDELSLRAQRQLKSASSILWRIVPARALAKYLPRAHGIILRSTSPFSKKEFQKAPHLKCLVMAGTGMDHIDLKEAQSRGIYVTNAAGANATAAAELTVGLLISLLRKIPQADDRVRRGRWTPLTTLPLRKSLRGFEISGKHVGIIGLGRVGRRVAARLQAFEAEVSFCDPYVSEANGTPFKKLPFRRLLETSDIISVHTPLTSETRGLLDFQALQICKRKPFLVNTARGSIVVEQDVVRALNKGLLSGFAADVFETEPIPRTSALLKSELTLLSPHVGAQTLEAQERVHEISVQRLIDYLLDGKTEGGF